MNIEIIYQDDDLIVVNKPSGISVFAEEKGHDKTLIDFLIDFFPELKSAGEAPRYGIIHRLDKDTSGVLLVGKNNSSIAYFQDKFAKGDLVKEYIALCNGLFDKEKDKIETLMARSPKDRRKQKSYPLYDLRVKGRARSAVTEYEVLKKIQNYTLIRVVPLTGRKHQIRSHMAYIHHPIVGDKLYGFKGQIIPKGLNRQFLHARGLTVEMPGKRIKSFRSPLPNDLKKILDNLKKDE
ncbi:MAG: RluA family pseudouridine synthase [Minisyncoccales bacterium]|jgi:23S rRNA pseudouridine1911/1915/1917 synthase